MKDLPFILTALLFLSGSVAAQERAVPVEEEPLHEMAMKNDYIEVMHVSIHPGQSSLLHAHSRDRFVVCLSESIMEEYVPGKNSVRTAIAPGKIVALASAKKPFTHRLHNIGTTPFEAIDIELLKRPDGAATPPITTPAAQDGGFRVYRWSLSPGASTPEHTHGRPYLIIAATPMQLVMKAPNGASMEHPIKAGDFHWIEDRVTHILSNSGNEAGIIFEVELK